MNITFRDTILSRDGLCALLDRRSLFNEGNIKNLRQTMEHPLESFWEGKEDFQKLIAARNLILKTTFELSKLCLKDFGTQSKIVSLMNPMYSQRKDLVDVPSILSKKDLMPAVEAFKRGESYKFLQIQLKSGSIGRMNLSECELKFNFMQEALRQARKSVKFYNKYRKLFSSDECRIYIVMVGIWYAFHITYLSMTQALLNTITPLTEKTVTSIQIEDEWKPLFNAYKIATTIPFPHVQHSTMQNPLVWASISRINCRDIDGYGITYQRSDMWEKESGLGSEYLIYEINEEMSIFNLQF